MRVQGKWTVVPQSGIVCYHIPGYFYKGNMDLFMLEYLSTGALGYK